MLDLSDKIIETLISKGILSRSSMQNLERTHADYTSEELIKHLISNQYISEDDCDYALSIIYGMPYANLKEVTLDPNLANIIPYEIAENTKILPLRLEQNILWIGADKPLSASTFNTIKDCTHYKIAPVLVNERLLSSTIKIYYNNSSNGNNTDTDHPNDMTNLNLSKSSNIGNLIDNASDDTSIIQLANNIIEQAVLARASDIHLEPHTEGIRIRYRVDGVLHTAINIPPEFTAPLTSRFKIMSDMNIAERRLPQDGRIEIPIHNKSWDLRTSTVPTAFGEKMVMRILDKSSVMIGLDKLGFADYNDNIIKELAAQPNGMILCTGPTGSGKTTTQYSLLHHLNKPSVNILTVEDPVEYQLNGITQVQVNRKAGLTFASALRSFLRQDPDIIMIGEMRDLETTQIAVESALTGHLVLSTLHTNDAPSAVMRLVDMGIEPYLISATVIGVLAQRLARKLCDSCKEEHKIKEEELAKWNLPISNPQKEHTIYMPKGCDKCRGTGYHGRVGLHELMVMNESIAELVVCRTPTHEIKAEAVKCGMKQLKDDGVAKILQGHIDPDEVVRVVSTIGY